MESNNALSNSIELTKKLIKKRKVLKRKLDLLKRSQLHTEQIFSPITKHLETIAVNLEKKGVEYIPSKQAISHHIDNYKNLKTNDVKQTLLSPSKVKVENRIASKVTTLKNRINDLKEDDLNIYHNINSTPKSSEYKNEIEDEIYEHDPMNDPTEEVDLEKYTLNELIDGAVEESKQNISGILDTKVYEDYLQGFDELPRQYIDGMLHDSCKEYDHRTGIRHNSFEEKFYIGSEEISFEGVNIKIKDTLFKGTPGLYELLFKNQPDKYSKEDLKNYKEILDLSNAHKRNFIPDGQILGTGTAKYRGIVKPLYFDVTLNTPKNKNKRTGKGFFKEFNNNPIDYVYWDDPNELVDRLRLLVASEKAGHTGHTNEKISIIEELRERHIIA